ncbi:MAG: hypothetical protein COW00_13900 [Bdellovibrio sp. CG12_big_fil_rev_8_21_14_0_65_39_13]|nr:MAG: hypothetical protein COW78_07325 [Bdellovibrio sp. CG22_combo_CG10-13_8_21_14_all_39_27]PIQ58707.1 MAG: hypothetical protein COW00_13900 [Bdellovibrio sp. CG12_big_fil_rev_8_21_14_0_65_39_13]PIR33082.1 MAG: hypothetical protein COV37_18495 [Bdellovibrio sp. CG11_big_fil_rev_8_21_14_0_20_39_38]
MGRFFLKGETIVSSTDIPDLIDFDSLSSILESERKSLLKINNFSQDDEGFVRSTEDANKILETLKFIQKDLSTLFGEFPTLMGLFDTEFVAFEEFIQRDFILDILFLEDCMIPEKEMFFFGQDGGLNPNILELHLKTLRDWIALKKDKHVANQTLIKDNFNIDMKSQAMECQCVACQADFRTRLREYLYDQCVEIVNAGKAKIEEVFETGKGDVSELYTDMQKSLDKIFHSVRFKLKRSTVNRLESQVKSYMREIFTAPSELAAKQKNYLVPFFKKLMVQEELNQDLITDEEYDRFLAQLNTNIWRNDRFLEREFKKLLKSVMFLKRKDISGKILQDYLGEFWIHSQARTITRKIIYHMGPTNSGKTYHAIEALCQAKKGCYLAPLRLLAAELYDKMNTKGVTTTLLTGEEIIEVEGATHYASTIEMAKLHEYFDCCVIDEIQMITDSQRGWAWTRALVNVFADEVHICGDASVLNLVKKIVELCGDVLEVRNYERMTKLNVENRPITLGELQKSDALIVFSRRNALKYKTDLERLDFKVSIVYGRLSPEVRREQARKFDQGETDIIVATDAISMGMNLPIRRIVFSTLTKYIDSKEHPITESEIKQIAGRAGRYQRYPTGFVTCLQKEENGLDQIRDALEATLEQQDKCMVGPDLEIFSQVNEALESNGLSRLRLSEFLRLFNTMIFQLPFFCVDLKEMIELAEMVEDADVGNKLTSAETFGFACSPVNLGLLEHVQYYVWILNNYVTGNMIHNEKIDFKSGDIDYLETTIKCVELYQWLSRHFGKNLFVFDEQDLLHNKGQAIEQLNTLLSDKIVPTCSSCGTKLSDKSKFAICEECFKTRRFRNNRGSQRGFGNKPGREGDKGPESGPNNNRNRGPRKFDRRPGGQKSGPGAGGPPGAPGGGSDNGPRRRRKRSNFKK